MSLSFKKVNVPWPVKVTKTKTVDVTVPIANNDKNIGKHTEIRLANISTGKKRAASSMAVCIGDV